eukprot:s274_g10.t1
MAASVASEETTELSATLARSEVSSITPSLGSAARMEGLRGRRSTASERRMLQRSVAVVSRLYDELLLLSLRRPKLGEAAASLLQELAGPGVTEQAEEEIAVVLSRCVADVRRIRLEPPGASEDPELTKDEALQKESGSWCAQS